MDGFQISCLLRLDKMMSKMKKRAINEDNESC